MLYVFKACRNCLYFNLYTNIIGKSKVNKITQEASALVEFIFFIKIGPKGSQRLPTSVITMIHEIMDTEAGVRLEKATEPQLLEMSFSCLQIHLCSMKNDFICGSAFDHLTKL